MGDFALKDKPVFGRAGEYPYTRGIHPDMYTKGNLPTVRKYGGFGSCGELNQHLKQQIALGVTGLSIAYDLPTQMGFDPDHSMALGEVGVNGVSVSSSKDYEEAFHGLFPEIISKGIGVSKTINATAPILLAFYVAAAKRQGVDPKELRGTIQNDVLKEYLSRNTFIYPLAGTLRLARDVFGWCKSELPRFNTISICGYHMREKGCTASQELAYMFSNAIEYLVTGVAGGLKIEEIASQVSFFINVKKNLFEEAAKLRAARRIWAQIIKEGFGVDHERSQKLRMQSYTGGSDLIKQKPQLNIVRDAVRTLAAVLGGPQGTNTTSFDEAITIPTALSQQIAIDTPYIILLEKALAQTVDPFGGSSYLEFLTDKIEAEVWSELDLISRCRTYQEALARMHRTLEDEAYREQKAEDSGQKKVAGKNWAKDNEKLYPSVPLFSPPGDPAKREKERLAAFRDFKAKRGREHYGQALRELKSAAQQPDLNLMPRILECAQSGATLGEISDALREAFGTADPSAPWEPSKPVEVFNGQLRGYLAKKAISFSSLRGVSYSVIASGAEAPRGNLIQGNSLHEIASPEARNDRIPFRFWKPIHHSRTHALTHSRTLIDAYPFRENGATAAQEIAYAISKVNKVNKATKALKNKKIHVLLSSGNNFIEEIAKFRAIRRLWLKMVPGTILEIYARTSASSLVKQKSWNNIARAALQALQAALGGADCIEIFPFDLPFRQKLTKVTKATLRLRSGQAKVTRGKEILNEWSKWAEQMAKDTHEVLRYEIGLLEAPFDPLAGSYEIDKKTEELEKEVLIELGKLNSLEPKEAQRYIQDSLQNLTRQNEAPIVGVMIQTQGPSPQPKRVKQ